MSLLHSYRKIQFWENNALYYEQEIATRKLCAYGFTSQQQSVCSDFRQTWI